MVAGAEPPPASGIDDLADQVAQRVTAGVSRKDAIADIAREYGIAKRVVYDAVVAAKARP